MRDKYLFVPSPNVPVSHAVICQDLIDLFAANKRSRKRLSDLATDDVLSELQIELAQPAPDVHPVLHRYEKRHLGIGNWGALSGSMRLRFNGRVELHRIGNSVNVFATAMGSRVKVGMIFLEESRFVRAPGVAAVNGKEIYVRRNDPAGRQYIHVHHSDSFVRRYVTRGLNGFDGMRLTLVQPLLPPVVRPGAQPSEIATWQRPRHAVALGAVLTQPQQVLSHTRGWGKRYISTGVSNRPALSTRGQQFHSIYGAITVDLAHVPDAQIIDLHSYRTADRYFTAQSQDVLVNGHHTGTNDIAEQSYLAMRDVLRTRELLIDGNLPFAAVLANSLGGSLLGIGSQSKAEHAGVAGQMMALLAMARAAVVSEDHTTFIDPRSNRRWHFVAFRNAALAQFAHWQFVATATQSKVRFNKYQPIRPAGMV